MYRIGIFDGSFEEVWDDFVINRSVNGTFLQTRNFLNYHPKDRFVDASLMVYDEKRLVAVIPACVVHEGGKTVFYSHKGSTYGGIIVGKSYYKTEKLLGIIGSIDDYLQKSYDKAVLKITADIHSKENSDLLQYALFYHGYDNYCELNTYIDLNGISGDVIKSFDRNKLRNIRKCESRGLMFRELDCDEEIRAFYRLLEINLSKYGIKPIHTCDELLSFKHTCIPENVRFYGVFANEVMMAGGMMFVFDNVNVIHAQNLSADYRFTEYSPITYLYYKVIERAKKDGFMALSWGVSTENQGRDINLGLIRNKESYGSKHQLNRTYFKNFDKH